jgi:hypothetical protein
VRVPVAGRDGGEGLQSEGSGSNNREEGLEAGRCARYMVEAEAGSLRIAV